MTDMWEQGRDLASRSTEVYSKKRFGREYWLEFLDRHHYWFVEWRAGVKQISIPMSYIHTPRQHRYEHQVEKFGYLGAWEHYQESCALIDKTLRRFDYMMYSLWDDALFSNKEFGQLVVLNRELYGHGAFNYPCYRYDGERLTAHPGQHLNYSRLYLGLPFKGWISASKDDQEKIEWIERNTYQRIEITDDSQIEQILGTNKIAASMQSYSDELIPSLYPSIPRPIWNGYDKNGNTDWPWDDARSIGKEFMEHPHFDLIVALCDADDAMSYFRSVAECHTNYQTEKVMLNNFAAFLTMGVKSDNNFTLNIES